ncbi:hypothetical protein J1614_007907 [Plenodomus biglobosus]|nr:hypothetical protein J1614_007907 [Plenodomus biglobosus]
MRNELCVSHVCACLPATPADYPVIGIAATLVETPSDEGKYQSYSRHFPLSRQPCILPSILAQRTSLAH